MLDLQPLTYAIISTIFVVGNASFIGRFYCRAVILKAFGWDDVASVFLLFVNAMQQTVLYMFLHYGCGKHASTLNSYQLEQTTKWLFIEEVFYMFTHWTIKQTLLVFYLRLSPSVWFRRLVIGTMVLNTAFTITNWLLAFLQCTPFDSVFHPALYPNATCINSKVLLMGPSILNIITDVTILLLPIRTVWSLQMSKRRKIAVLSVISFGASSVVVALCRFIILQELSVTQDTSYTLGKMVIVAGLEIQLAVVAVNLPSMKALWTKITGGSTAENSAGATPGGKGYKLSSFRDGSLGLRGKRSKAGPIGEVSITNHIATYAGTDSEEELWRKEYEGEIHVTRSFHVSDGEKAP